MWSTPVTQIRLRTPDLDKGETTEGGAREQLPSRASSSGSVETTCPVGQNFEEAPTQLLVAVIHVLARAGRLTCGSPQPNGSQCEARAEGAADDFEMVDQVRLS